jgi:hypothetical protein
VPSTSFSRCIFADTTAPTLYTDGASVHPVLKDFSPKHLCMLLRDRRIDRRYLWPKASIHPVLKRLSWRVSVFIQIECRIDWRCPHSDRRIIRCYYLHCSSSAIHPTHLQNGLSVHPMVPTSFCLLRSVPTTPTLCTDGTVGSSNGVFYFPFLPRFWPFKHRMNHQNQTRTNGIWGHVRYRNLMSSSALPGYLYAGAQVLSRPIEEFYAVVLWSYPCAEPR